MISSVVRETASERTGKIKVKLSEANRDKRVLTSECRRTCSDSSSIYEPIALSMSHVCRKINTKSKNEDDLHSH